MAYGQGIDPPRRWPLHRSVAAVTVVVTVALAACAGSSRPVAVVPTSSAATTSAPTTTAPSTSTTVAPATSTTAAPTTTTTVAPVDAVRRVVARLYGWSLTDAEATCLAGALPMTTVDALDAASDADPGPGPILAMAQAAARCEPADYVASQGGLLTEQFGLTDEQATCVTRAVDQVALVEPAVAGALLDDWAAVPAGSSRDSMIEAATTCVDRDLAITIVVG